MILVLYHLFGCLERISCVRWNPLGDMLATTSDDQTIKMLDFGTGKVLYTGSSHSSEFRILRNIYS